MNVILTVENLKKHFEVPGGNLHAVDGISFSIKKGETFGVVGESGCGKSTLCRTIIHIHQPTSGRIYFENDDINISVANVGSLRRCNYLSGSIHHLIRE